MGTVRIPLDQLPGGALLPASNFGRAKNVSGTNNPISGIALAKTAGEEGFFLPFVAANYGSGNVTVRVRWWADTASSGDIVLGAALQAITPNTDTQDVTTDGFDTEATTTDSHLGTTNKREHELTITVSATDSLTAMDSCMLRVRRKNSGSDTMSGDAIVREVIIEYSDT